jgi:hypothetical protein
MNKQKGLPLEFKLLLKDKIVGYENHITIGKQGGCLHIVHSVDGENWQHVYNRTNYLFHDEKRQWTGYKDKNGDKIYFGDKFINDRGDIFTVKISEGRIFGKNKEFHITEIWPQKFNKMELTDG